MTISQPSTNQTPSNESLAWFETELRDTLRSHEARLLEPTQYDDISVAIRRRSEEAHGEIVAALARIHDGSFGRCESCETAIGLDRLEVMPHTRYCLGCAT